MSSPRDGRRIRTDFSDYEGGEPRWEPSLERARGNVQGAGLADRITLRQEAASDISDVDTLQAYRGARDELQSLLARWEELFERSQVS